MFYQRRGRGGVTGARSSGGGTAGLRAAAARARSGAAVAGRRNRGRGGGIAAREWRGRRSRGTGGGVAGGEQRGGRRAEERRGQRGDAVVEGAPSGGDGEGAESPSPPPPTATATATASDLRPPEHQVARHRASTDKLGPLVDGEGLFYKPLQAGEHGEQEAAFYATFSAHPAFLPCV
uniref:Uncharacterized protein n=1 Tax=Oryza meridionalis TaxID=40149 RepID=A0A0E0CMV5_9ORYZ